MMSLLLEESKEPPPAGMLRLAMEVAATLGARVTVPLTRRELRKRLVEPAAAVRVAPERRATPESNVAEALAPMGRWEPLVLGMEPKRVVRPEGAKKLPLLTRLRLALSVPGPRISPAGELVRSWLKV